MAPVAIAFLLYIQLDRWLNPVLLHFTEKGFAYNILDLPRWVLFENGMQSEVRLCTRNESSEVPEKLRGQGMVLRPGQKRKICLPANSYFDIEAYDTDGKRLEQIKLRIAISLYAE